MDTEPKISPEQIPLSKLKEHMANDNSKPVSTNGKGDKARHSLSKFRAGYEEINWSNKPKVKQSILP